MKKSKSGFSIVELMIVFVVVGILAAIPIVAYSGIRNKAKTSAGQSLANQKAKKADTYGVVKGTYPLCAELIAGDPATPEAKIDSPSSVQIGTVNPTTANNGKTVTYQGCPSQVGGYTQYYDYSASAAVTRFTGIATTGLRSVDN